MLTRIIGDQIAAMAPALLFTNISKKKSMKIELILLISVRSMKSIARLTFRKKLVPVVVLDPDPHDLPRWLYERFYLQKGKSILKIEALQTTDKRIFGRNGLRPTRSKPGMIRLLPQICS